MHVHRLRLESASQTLSKSTADSELKQMIAQLLQDNAVLKKQLEAKEGMATPSTGVPSKRGADEIGDGFDEDELEKAMDASRASAGLSSSSKAGSFASKAPGPDDVDVDGESVAPEVEDVEAEREEKEEPCKPDDGPTSTSHKKEYMMLTRRMETADAAKFPEVSALWNASRAVSLIADQLS